jgi:hypothetical protein
MNPQDNHLTKGNAIAYIAMQVGCGRPRVERALKQLADEGRIHPATFPYAILYSPADVELVIKVLKGESK